MNTNSIIEADKIFYVLTKGRTVEREAVQYRLLANKDTIDINHLRTLIINALNNEYSVESTSENPKSQLAKTRGWLLSTLGRIIGNNKDASDYVRNHTLKEFEPNGWARYWALEGLCISKAPNLKNLALRISSDDDHLLVKMLATAILASNNDSSALEEILKGIKEKKREPIRAVRVVPIENTVKPLCEIVESPKLTNATYDSIVALGNIPKEWPSSEKAVEALIKCIKECRNEPWWDGIRSKALRSLHNLRSSEAVPIIIKELSDSNPSIVYESARALESIIGVSKATERIVEAASQTGEEAIYQYATALRWMNREKVVEELEYLMISGAWEEQNTAREMLSEIGGHEAFEKLRAKTDTIKQHLATLEKTEEGIRELFDVSFKEARTGYKLSIAMDTVVFIIGICFMVLSGILVITDKETLAGITGAGGVLAVLYNLFFANPRNRVQQAVENLMIMKIIFLGYLRQLHQADKAFVRRFLEDASLSTKEIKKYSLIVAENMRDAVKEIRQLSKKIEKEKT